MTNGGDEKAVATAAGMGTGLASDPVEVRGEPRLRLGVP
jgi:hypothetical protein